LDQELADAIEYLRERIGMNPVTPPGRPAFGDASEGGILYARTCRGCHGEKGLGGSAPELANTAFLAAATDGYLQASIIRGRLSAGMPAFGSENLGYPKLSAQEASDIVRYIRSLSEQP
jgi:mono/diheme cytochrome c family protein